MTQLVSWYFLMILIVFCCVTAPPVLPTEKPPLQKINIAFDLNEGRLFGSSVIELPPETGATISYGDLKLRGTTSTGPGYKINESKSVINIRSASRPQRIQISYEKSFPRNIARTDGYVAQDGITLTGFWHPMLERKALFELTATVPNDFMAISEAEEITAVQTPQGKAFHFLYPAPLAGLHFAAGPYIVERKPFGNGKELFTYFFPEDRALANRYMEMTLSYLERYENLIGPFPYKRFSVVENRLPTGFAMPTFTLLGQMVVRLPFITETSLGHEVLHSWFGSGVDINRKQGNWAEGLTTYLADHLVAEDKGNDAEFRKNQLIKYSSYVYPDNVIALKDFRSAFHLNPGERSTAAVGYSKSVMVFHMLKNRIGEEAFFAAVKDFYARMNGKSASWDDVATSFEKTTHSSMREFFSQWLERIDIPEIQIKGIAVEEKEGRPILSFSVIQTTEKPYAIELPFQIRTMEGTLDQTITLAEAETKTEIALSATPLELIIDKDYDLMRKLTTAEFPPVWSRLLGGSHKLGVIDGPPEESLYAPLFSLFHFGEDHIVQAGEVTDDLLAGHSIVFFGADLLPARAIFADANHPGTGFTVDVRTNPLNPDETAVLISTENRKEITAALHKLGHYGKYSYLHFENGRVTEKTIQPGENGQRYKIRKAPEGIATRQSLTFQEIMADIAEKRVIYVGENHTRFEDHQMQLEVIRALHSRNLKIALGLEMFSRIDQEALDEFISRKIDEREFLKKTNYFKRWGFDYRLYRDMLNFARLNHIPVVALNLDKEIVSKVYKQGGVSSLTDEEKKAIPADRDLDVPGYRDRLITYFLLHDSSGAENDRFKNFLQSQALWDETMAETITDYLQAHPDRQMVIIAGQGHVVKNTAIPPRVYRRMPVEQVVLVNAADKIIQKEHADYLIFLPKAELPKAALLGVSIEDSDQGVVVKNLSPHGGAQKAGIEEDDIILAIDGVAIPDVDTLRIEMLYKKSGDTVKVRVKRRHSLLFDSEREVEVPL
ncbi:MAG: ChaN family lipoprotein [Desulfobacterales bacterium]